MEDDNIKDLFSGFSPELPSDSLFMRQLDDRLQSVELIRRHSAELRRRSTMAVAIAAVAGFIAGMLFVPAISCIEAAAAGLLLSVPADTVLAMAARNSQLITGLLMSVVSVTIAVNTYELSLSLMNARRPTH